MVVMGINFQVALKRKYEYSIVSCVSKQPGTRFLDGHSTYKTARNKAFGWPQHIQKEGVLQLVEKLSYPDWIITCVHVRCSNIPYKYDTYFL